MNAQPEKTDADTAELRTVVSLKRAPGHRKKAEAVYRRISIKEAAKNKGARLLNVVNKAMAKRNHTIEDVSAELGISTVYLRAIGDGKRSFSDVDRMILRKVARYVELPVAQVFLLADTLNAADFFYEQSLPNELSVAYDSMCSHPMWTGYAPATDEWEAMSVRNKLFIVMLYEAATNQSFLTSASVDSPDK